ncbi:recombinase family protein [Paraburkholderia sp. SIMBA_054]|uniref:recombinase family protein n=1 Tax=Paraburkholderia sp. SIMBA_054 TaxID=3085795 RepID=UPI00397CED0E
MEDRARDAGNRETASGASQKRPLREEVMKLARTHAVDVILVQALDRWGRCVQDLILTMAELEALGVAFVVPGQIDMSTPKWVGCRRNCSRRSRNSKGSLFGNVSARA